MYRAVICRLCACGLYSQNSWNTAVTAIPAFRNVQPPQPISTNNPLGTTADVQAAILKQSSHPGALFCLYFFRSAAIAVYVLCGLCELSVCICTRPKLTRQSLTTTSSLYVYVWLWTQSSCYRNQSVVPNRRGLLLDARHPHDKY